MKHLELILSVITALCAGCMFIAALITCGPYQLLMSLVMGALFACCLLLIYLIYKEEEEL